MKVKIQTTTETEIDIDFPSYKKGSCHYFKLINEKIALQVTDLGEHSNIGIIHTDGAFVIDTVECTDKEFEHGFNKVKDLLKQYAND